MLLKLNIVSVRADRFDFFGPAAVVTFFAATRGAIADKKVFWIRVHVDEVIDAFSQFLGRGSAEAHDLHLAAL